MTKPRLVFTRMLCKPMAWPPMWCSVMPGAISLTPSWKRDAAGEHLAHHRDHVVLFVGEAELLVAHAAAGAVVHLLVLHVVAGARKQIDVAAVVVVHVADDDVLDLVGIDAEPLQALADRRDDGAAALGRRPAGRSRCRPRRCACRCGSPRRNSRAAAARRADRRRCSSPRPCADARRSGPRRFPRCRRSWPLPISSCAHLHAGAASRPSWRAR